MHLIIWSSFVQPNLSVFPHWLSLFWEKKTVETFVKFCSLCCAEERNMRVSKLWPAIYWLYIFGQAVFLNPTMGMSFCLIYSVHSTLLTDNPGASRTWQLMWKNCAASAHSNPGLWSYTVSDKGSYEVIYFTCTE